MPKRIQDIVNDRAGSNIAVYSWECLKIVDLPFFAQELKSYCRDKIDSQCLAEITRDFGEQISATSTVILSSYESSGIPTGECVRAYEAAGIIGKAVLKITNRKNIVMCSIGDKGLLPGEAVTFDFVAIVPADAPVIPPAEIDKIQGMKQGYTQSVACEDSATGQSCHSIYAAVYPMGVENFINWIASRATSVLYVGGCTFTGIFQEGSTKQCLATRGQNVNAVGQPLWEGAGTFFIIGPVLRGSINLLLFAVYAATIMMGAGLGGKK